MKKTIALASALLLTSSLLVGCGNNDAGPTTQGTEGKVDRYRAGTMTTDRAPGFNTRNMREDLSLERQVNSVLGTRQAKVYVSNNAAYVMLDRYTDNRIGRQGVVGRQGEIGRVGVQGRQDARSYGTGVGDRTIVDGTGRTGLFGTRIGNGVDEDYGGLFGTRIGNGVDEKQFGSRLGDGVNTPNRGGLFGTGIGNGVDENQFGSRLGDRVNTPNRGGLFGTGIGNGIDENQFGSRRGNDLDDTPGTGIGNRGTAGIAGYGYGTANNTPRTITGDAGLTSTTRAQIIQAIQKANPSIRNVYFIS